MYPNDVFDYFLDEFSIEYELNHYEDLSLDSMRKFYKNADRIKKIKAKNIGKREPNPTITDETIKEITEDYGENSNSITASVGRTKENLQSARFIKDGIAKYSDLNRINRVNRGKIEKLRDSGIFDFLIDAGKDEEEQAEEVRDTVSSIVRSVFSGESAESEAND